MLRMFEALRVRGEICIHICRLSDCRSTYVFTSTINIYIVTSSHLADRDNSTYLLKECDGKNEDILRQKKELSYKRATGAFRS